MRTAQGAWGYTLDYTWDPPRPSTETTTAQEQGQGRARLTLPHLPVPEVGLWHETPVASHREAGQNTTYDMRHT